ncbi:hypothetical protein ACWTU6_30040 [Mesorhizobium sp. BHbsci]
MPEHQAGAKAGDLARKHGYPTRRRITGWRGMAGWTLRRQTPEGPEDENAKLKKLLADQILEVSALRELLSKNVWSASSCKGSRHRK